MVGATEEEALMFFHGTARIYERQIARHGLRSFRESGEVYVTPVRARALRYAQMWAVGLNAIGEMDRPNGIIVAFELGEDTTLWECETDEFSVRPAPASAIRNIEHFDFSGLSQSEKTMCLLDLLAVVRWDYDRYTRDKFDLIAIEADKAIKQIPADELRQANAEEFERVRRHLLFD
ncbi:MAG: hypothetical protein ACYTGS_16415 [Planctomycetota bacterium]